MLDPLLEHLWQIAQKQCHGVDDRTIGIDQPLHVSTTDLNLRPLDRQEVAVISFSLVSSAVSAFGALCATFAAA